MNNNQKFYLMVMNEAPENSILRISSSSEELHDKLRYIKEKDINDGYNLVIILTPSNRKQLITLSEDNGFIENIHYFQLQFHHKIIFKSYDGFEIGEVLKESNLYDKSYSFIKKKMCAVID